MADPAPSFPVLFRQAEMSAPRLIEAETNVSAAQGRAQQASAWLNPIIDIEVEDFAGSGAYRGSSQAQTTVSISEPLELGGQRSARVAAGRAELSTSQARRAQARVEFGSELAIAYASAEAAQSRRDLLTEDVSRAQEDLRSARALVEAGKEGELRAVQAEAAAATAQAELESARAEVIASLAQLSALVGVTEPYTSVQSSLLVSAQTVSNNSERSESVIAPMIATAQAEREVAERRLTVEQKRAIPSPSLSVGARRIAGDNAHAWVAGVSIPLPLFDRDQGDIAAARAEVTAADARLKAAQLDTDADLRIATAQATAANSQMRAADQAEVAAGEAYRLARIGYDAGRTPLYELLGTRRALIEAQTRSLDARLARVRAEAALARVAGRIPFVE